MKYLEIVEKLKSNTTQTMFLTPQEVAVLRHHRDIIELLSNEGDWIPGGGHHLDEKNYRTTAFRIPSDFQPSGDKAYVTVEIDCLGLDVGDRTIMQDQIVKILNKHLHEFGCPVEFVVKVNG